MASGTIKGITIEIEGKTSGLVKSLGDVNKSLSLTQKSLKTVDQALKLDPGNIDTIRKKQEILATAIEQTKEKLELEKKAAEDAAKALQDGTITKSQYDALQAEVAKTAAEMNKLEKEAVETDKALDKTAETGRFDKLKGALSKVGNGLKIAGQAAGTIVAGATAAAGALIKVTSGAAETADEIDKMSQKIGISKKAYQEWSYVMGQNGMDVNILQTGMKTLNTQILKTQGATDKSKTSLGKLGIAVTDSTGKLRAQEDILYDTITALANMDEGADRAKLAQELLGKSGSELAPLLNQGSGAIKDLTKRAHELGLIMSDEAVDAGVKLGDTMDDVKKSFKALATNLGSSLMPVVQKFSDKVLEFMPRFQSLFDQIGPALTDFLDRMLPVLFDLGEQLLPPILDLTEAITPVLTEIVSAILPVVAELLNTIMPVLTDLVKSVLPILVTLIEAVSPILKAVVDILKPLLDLVMNLIKPLLELINNILKPLTDLFQGVGDTLSTVLGPAIELIGGLLNNLLGPAFEAIGGIVDTVCSVVFGSWEDLGEKLKGLWEGLKGFASKIWKEISSMADAAVEAVLGAIDDSQTALAKGVNETYARLGTTEAEVEAKKAQNRAKLEERTRAQTRTTSGMPSNININIGSERVDTVVVSAGKSNANRTGGH